VKIGPTEREDLSVELRRFEPLTPSMRTERTIQRNRCYTTFLHVSGFQLGTVTPSDRTCQRPTAPILLPKSDTVFVRLSRRYRLRHDPARARLLPVASPAKLPAADVSTRADTRPATRVYKGR